MKTEREPEPSMDEILASIRQIISGDFQEERETQSEEEENEILDLLNPLPEEEGRKVEPTKYPKIEEYEGLVSPITFSETTNAFRELNTLSQKKPNIKEASQNRVSNEKTIESLMREMLKPLLKEWLDANLPSIVRWVVTEQVEKIVRDMAHVDRSSVNEKLGY